MYATNKILRKFLDSRESYERYAPYLLALKNADRDFRYTLQIIQSYYNKYTQVDSATGSDLLVYLSQEKIQLPQTTIDAIKALGNVDMGNDELTLDIIEQTVEKHIASKILDKVALVIDNDKANILPSIQGDIDEYVSILRNPPKMGIQHVDFDLGRILKDEVKTKGLPFCVDTMNTHIGGARPGTNGFIFAYVDTGKTSFGVANLVSMARYINAYESGDDRPLVYGGNEESIQRVALRATQCFTKMSNDELVEDEKRVAQLLQTNGFQRLRFVDHVNSMSSVERILEQYNPRVLFIDQGTKVRLSGQQQVKDVNVLEEIFNNYRELGKVYECAIIALAQADSESDDKKWLDLRNIYGSKVAIQGELDWAVGIGQDLSDIKYVNWRYINICKNKFGDKKGFSTRFDAKRCQFREVQE